MNTLRGLQRALFGALVKNDILMRVVHGIHSVKNDSILYPCVLIEDIKATKIQLNADSVYQCTFNTVIYSEKQTNEELLWITDQIRSSLEENTGVFLNLLEKERLASSEVRFLDFHLFKKPNFIVYGGSIGYEIYLSQIAA